MPSEIMRPMVVSSTFLFFIASHAADSEGVTAELINFLHGHMRWGRLLRDPILGNEP